MLALAVPARSFAQAPTFNALVTTSTGNPNYEHPNLAGVADFNGDGKLDALISTGSENLRLMLGNGNGTFTQLYVSTPGAGNQSALRVADLNGDGRLDAITASNQGNLAAAVLINTGNVAGVPQFSVTNYTNPGFGTSGLRSLTIGDLNGGKPDFIVGNAHGALRVWLNNGDGTFTGGQYYAIQPGTGQPSAGPGVIVDLNGDGNGDFIESSGQASATDVFLGNGDGTLQAPVVIQLPGRSPGAIAAADLNNDGKPDFAEALSDGSVAVFLNNGNGTFGAPVSYQLPPTGNPSDLYYINVATSVAIADINGDGNLDLVAGYAQQWYASYGIAMFTGNGDGTFGPVAKVAMNGPPLDVSANDFNGDGKPDIARVGYNDNTYGVLLNTTVFAPPLPTQTLTILGGDGSVGGIAANVEYYNPATGFWQPAYLTGGHPWGFVPGTNSWINYKVGNLSDPGAGPTTNQTRWYLYRVRFTVPADAINPKMTFSLKADNFAQVAINGATAGGSTQYINNANVSNVVVGTADQVNVDAAFSQNVHVGENTITLNIGDWGGLNGFNFRIDLSMQSAEPLETVPTLAPSETTVSFGVGPFVYTGAAFTATESVSPSGVATIVYSGDCTNAGSTCTATATYAGDATHLGSSDIASITIDPAATTTTVGFGAGPFVYTGSAFTATASTSPIGTPTIVYAGDCTNAGSTCTATATYDGDANHFGSSDSKSITIAKRSSVTTVTFGAGPFVYTGSAFTATATVSPSGTATIAYSGDCVNGGTTCSATATYAGDLNHFGSDQTASIVITYAVCSGSSGGGAAKQSGSTIPVKIRACNAQGQSIGSSSLPVKAISLSPAGSLNDSGKANPGNLFRLTDGSTYMFNLSTKGLSSGSYMLNYAIGNDPTVYQYAFGIK